MNQIPSANVQNIVDGRIRLPTPYYVFLNEANRCRDRTTGEYVHFRVKKFETDIDRVTRIHVIPYDTVNQQWLDSTHVCLEPPFDTGLDWRTFGLSLIVPPLPPAARIAGGLRHTKRNKRNKRNRKQRKSRRY